MKLAVIGGAGLLGSTAAFCAGQMGVLEEIKLIDIKENMVMSHVMDMDQALCTETPTRVTKGDYDSIADCEIVLITASVPETGTGTRDSYLAANRKILEGICAQLRDLPGDRVIVNAVNPVDVLNVVIQDCTGLDRRRIVGFSINDTVRLRWAVAKVLGVSAREVDAVCMGEHGDNTVPLLSRLLVRGEPVRLTPEQRAAVSDETGGWFARYQGLKSGRTSGWTSGANLARIVAAIAADKGETLPCSAILDGEYGLSGLSVGVPARLGRTGVISIPEYTLAEEERAGLDKAVAKIRSLLRSIGY